MKSSTKHINKIDLAFKIFIIITALTLFLVYYCLPLTQDEWQYSSVYGITPSLYFPIHGWHMGRHFSEVFYILSLRGLGQLIGAAIGNFYIGIKISQAIFAPAIILSLIYISSLFVNNKNKSEKQLTIILLLQMFYWVATPNNFPVQWFYTYIAQIMGSVLLTLTAWLPILYFYRKGYLPNFMEKNPYLFYGIMLPVFYIGTQVNDHANWLGLGLSIAALIFLWGHQLFPHFFKPDIKPSKLLWLLLLTHIAHGLWAVYRNIFSGRFWYQKQVLNFSFEKIYQTLFSGSIYQDISIILGILIAFWYCYRFFKYKSISRESYLNFSLLVCSLILILTVAIMNTYYSPVLWSLWIAELKVFMDAYNKHKKFFQIFLPLMIFSSFVAMFSDFDQGIAGFEIRQKADAQWLQDIIRTSQQNQVLILEKDIAERINVIPDSIPDWALHYNYIQKKIPIIITNNKN